jgi:hypothetical protein
VKSRDVVRRLRAWQAGEPLPRHSTRHLSLAEDDDVLLVAFVRMGGEALPWGVAFAHPGDEPTVHVVPEARNRDEVAGMLAAFAPALLRILGQSSADTQAVLVILGLTMLVATGIGPVDVVLLMGGKSSYNLINTVVALSVNVALNLLLIPRFGIVGAAVAWSVSILINNLAPLAQVWAMLRIHPFGAGSPIVAGTTIAIFGGVGLLVRWAFGESLLVLLVYGAIVTAIYAAIVWRFRSPLELRSFNLRRRPKGSDAT